MVVSIRHLTAWVPIRMFLKVTHRHSNLMLNLKKEDVSTNNCMMTKAYRICFILIIDDLRKTKWRFVMLFLACAFLVGNYFCYDNPSVLEKQMERSLNIDQP